MFGVNNLWGTGKNQDILNDSLFGTVNLISYKKVEFSNKKEGNNINGIKKSKRKSRENECEFKTKNKKKKKNIGIINEGCVESNFNINENNSNHIPKENKFIVDNILHQQFDSENRHIDKESKKKRKRNSKNSNNHASNQQKNILKNIAFEEISSSVHVEEHRNEIYLEKSTESEINHKVSEVGKKRKKRKQKGAAGNSNKIVKSEEEEKMIIIPSIENSKGNKQIIENSIIDNGGCIHNEKSKVKKRKRKQKKNETAKNSDKLAILVNEDNIKIPSSDGTCNQISNSQINHNKINVINTIQNDTNREKLNIKKKKRKGTGKGTSENSDKIETSEIQDSTKVFSPNNMETKHINNSEENSPIIEHTDMDNVFQRIDTQISSSNNLKWQQSTKYNKFQKKIAEKLKGGQFRWINEKLYSCKSSDAVDMFSSDPKLFDIYHNGFHSQVQQWPQNPVDVIIEYIKARDDKLVVADFGCGDAKISKNVSNKVHAFDLVAINEHVTACDMKNVPLSSNSIDIVVFCLSLMGTNLQDFLMEAGRVVKSGGILKIAEVKSRFEDVDKFIKGVCSLGFSLIQKDDSNKMFVLMEFQKMGEIPSKMTADISLKPCIYKRR